MIDQENRQVTSRDTLLTSQEQTACKQITASEAPHSQRAKALLALNEGGTHAEAAEQSGLTLGQVKYWITRFRKQRLAVFPEQILNEAEAEEPKSATEKAVPTGEITADTEVTQGEEPKKKTGKSKKNKKAKKARKAKKKLLKARTDEETKVIKKTEKQSIKAKEAKKLNKAEKKTLNPKNDEESKMVKKTEKKSVKTKAEDKSKKAKKLEERKKAKKAEKKKKAKKAEEKKKAKKSKKSKKAKSKTGKSKKS